MADVQNTIRQLSFCDILWRAIVSTSWNEGRENKNTQTFLETSFELLFLFRNFYIQSTSVADYFPIMTCLDFDGKIFRQLLFLSLLFSFHAGVSSWCGDDNVQNGKQTLNWASSSRKAFPFGVWSAQICIYIKAWPEVGWYWSSKEELSSRGEVAEAGKRWGRILSVLGCDDLLSQLLAQNRVSSLKRFQRQSYMSWCVCMQYHAKSAIPALYLYTKMHLQYVSVKSLISFQMFPLQFTDHSSKSAQFCCIFWKL